ncbi:hypothetical protein L6R49_07005 [Myxococcota bacterium]|nr:hypothetical protein [Myxococcota bacterium]
MPEARWRAAIRECLEALGRLAFRGRALDRSSLTPLDAPRREELKRIRRGLYEALNHPITLIGCFDGFDAREARRLSLLARLDAEGEVVNLEQLQIMIEITCDLVAGIFLELLDRPRLELVNAGPHSPGPDRALALCRAHLEALAAQVSRLGDGPAPA